MSFMDYSCVVPDELEGNKTEVTINKQEEKSNKEFITDLNRIADELESDIMYLHTDVSGEKVRKDYFITTHASDFFHLHSADVKKILTKYDGITNGTAKENFFRVKGSTLLYEIYIFDITKAEEYNLESCNYYIDEKLDDRFINSLTKEGYVAYKVNGKAVKSNYVALRTLILPMIILLTSILFYFIGKRKENAIKLLEGYSKLLIVMEDSVKCFVIMLLINVILVCLCGCITMFAYNVNTMEYLMFSIKHLFPYICFVMVSVFVSNAFAVVSLKIYHIKGKDENYDLYVVSYMLKVIFSFLLILSFSNVWLEIRNIIDINRANVHMSNEIKSYITLPVNSSSTTINNTNQLEFNARLDEFYEKTVDEYSGILINTRNYRMVNLNNKDSLAEQYGQTSITVNENYLDINIIQDVNGEPITEEDIVPRKFNLLIPENQRENKEDIIDSYVYSYDLEEKDINYVFYKQNEKIHTFNPYSGREEEGILLNPVIEIYNKKYLGDQMLNYVSGQYLLLKVAGKDPYAELLPILRECKLDGIILYVTRISNVFDNSIANIKMRLNNDILNVGLCLISIVLLILYNCIVYFQIYGKKIVFKRLSGYGFVEIHTVPLGILFTQYVAFLLAGNAVPINQGAVLCVFIAEICIFAYDTYRLQKKYVLDVIKGGA